MKCVFRNVHVGKMETLWSLEIGIQKYASRKCDPK